MIRVMSAAHRVGSTVGGFILSLWKLYLLHPVSRKAQVYQHRIEDRWGKMFL